MNVREVRKLDHAEAALSTAAASAHGPRSSEQPHPSTASERDNELIERGHPHGSAVGHVESHFLKAHSDDGERALWIKHTLLIPRGRRDLAVAEVWAIAFADQGRRKLAIKQSYPVASAHIDDRPFASVLPSSHFGHGRAHGELVDTAGQTLGWELSYEMPSDSFRPFPLAGMYSGPFPRSKSLTPAPDTRAHGEFRAFGERWAIDGWRAAQGHNWGKSHAHAYAWVHANAWRREPGGPLLDDTWLEALSGRVRVGPVVTPFLTVVGLTLEGRSYRFDRPRALLSRAVTVASARVREPRPDLRSYDLAVAQGGARLETSFSAASDQFAGLRYVDPDGAELACLNSKLAHGQLELHDGKQSVRLFTHAAALELGTRTPDHGIALLV